MSGMIFEEYFDKFLNKQSFSGQKSNQMAISKEEYESLKTKMKNFELLAEKHKEIKSQNDKLLKEIDDMKEDGKNFKKLMEEKENYFKSLLRIRADFENYKKISERENDKYKSYVMERILKKLIDHHDDLVRALNLIKILENMGGIKDGFEIIVKNFEKVLEEEGVKRMKSEGEKFDPYKHEAIIVEEGRDDLPENTILEELEKGYYLNNKILRPAKVKISKNNRNLNNQNKKKKRNKNEE